MSCPIIALELDSATVRLPLLQPNMILGQVSITLGQERFREHFGVGDGSRS